jgi:hypothetical protein
MEVAHRAGQEEVQMQQLHTHRQPVAPAVLGVLLIGVGAMALVLREMGVDLFDAIGTWGWPFFVIVPGVALLAAALLPAPPKGVGFATAGGVVTTVGMILLYQSRSGHWESWAYVWALIPMGAGVATFLYGLLTRERRLSRAGLTMAGIAGALFVTGAWFFEGLFAGEFRPADITEWWPIGIIVLGGVIVVRSFLFPARAPATEALAEHPAVDGGQARGA